MKSFLIIEDDIALAKLCEYYIKMHYNDAFIKRVLDGKKGLDEARKFNYTVILTNVHMPIISGIEVYKILKKERPHMAKRVGFVSGDPCADTISYIEEEGLQYLKKPYMMKDFLNLINKLLELGTEESVEKQGFKCKRKSERFKIKKECLLEPIDSVSFLMNPISAEIIDQSEEGLGILCNSMRLPKGIKVDVLIDTLNAIKKRAEVIWSECEDGGYRLGLQWV